MRLKDSVKKEAFRIMAVDDEPDIIASLQLYLNKYDFVGYTNPVEAIEALKNEHFDLLLLDFLMSPIHGDQVVEEIRKFNNNLYILLLTGHKDLAPPLETIKRLDIQGYCEKSSNFDQMILLVESGLKSVSQMKIINEINEKLELAYSDLKKAYRGTVEALRLAVDAKDSYTKNHSDRVALYSKLIGEKLGLPDDQLEILYDGALFHDIGKIGVPDSILQKTSKLTDDEYDDIKNHPSIGTKILSPAKIFDSILPIVKHHHERFDGKGYPSGLKGEEIPFLARIVSIADSFDAMTSDRSYRPRFTLVKAIDELENGKSTQFDPDIVDAFVVAFKEHRKEIEKATKIDYLSRKED